MDTSTVHAISVCRSYRAPAGETRAVVNASLSLLRGEFVALVGPSGCGKSSLLNILGLVDAPDSGELYILNEKVDFRNEKQLRWIRRSQLGFVFQQFNLLPTMTALENVMVPLLLNGKSASAREEAERALLSVGLGHKLTSFPGEMSGGEMQRVACARAVVHRPALIIADEPTGNLDSNAGAQVLALLAEHSSQGATVIMATHSESAMSYCSKVIPMKDGVISQ